MGEAEAPQFIHGVLEATIFKAENLHHTISGSILEGTEKLIGALDLHVLPHSKLYATIDVGRARVARTRGIEFHPQHPTWNESFRVYCCHSASTFVVSIKNQLPLAAKVLGRARIPVSRVVGTDEPVLGWFDLYKENGHKLYNAKIHVLLKFSDVNSDPFWNAGVSLPLFSGVPNVYFRQRTGCDVTLYQNSHLSDSFRPSIRLSNGAEYKPERLWEDLYKAIVEAKHFIYITGWSVNVNITLVRDPKRMIPGAEDVTVGELLKRKAEEGVVVLVMVWHDQTSLSFLGNAGLMKTFDEETREYFKGTKVKCFLCPRNADPDQSAIQQTELTIEFTHHQKTVTLDAPANHGGGDGDSPVRRIISFIGGIDICGGRYDDENHTLFQNLNTLYRNDFQQKNFPGADLRHGGPRESWHDIHSKLEGLAAWDVLTNFEQRWKKQSPPEMLEYLLSIEDMSTTFPVPQPSQTSDSWNVQVFRSIDDASVEGFPSDPTTAVELGLTTGKDVTIDQSIHIGYIEAIRRAKRFIYIENQYFLGSCASWREDQDSGCLNLVPIEIAAKIVSKIRAGERFAAYIITPMWPEGEPEHATVQAVLHWNRLTMEMMYGMIAEAIEEVGLGGKVHPCDYLNFFCLGNRELQQPGEYIPPERPEPETNYWKAQINRRFLVYVHAKLMIVDDEYVIVGSANLNQRSLDGSRDTEIVHGSYQPQHLNGAHGHARGIIHGFRMSLWYEHFKSHYKHATEVFLEPESLECVKKVRQIAEDLWAKYVGDEVVDLPGHLLPFPIRVSEDGSLSELTEGGCFPDTNGSIKGKNEITRPPMLTT